MTGRNWKKVRPRSIRHAMELCLDYARETHNRSVDRVADLMGVTSKWTIYKWVESGRIPAIEIRPFEHACGIDFVTQWIGTSAHKLLVDIPAGKPSQAMNVAELQESFGHAIAVLSKFYRGKASAEDTVDALDQVLTGAAWHKANVLKDGAPELDLFGGGDA